MTLEGLSKYGPTVSLWEFGQPPCCHDRVWAVSHGISTEVSGEKICQGPLWKELIYISYMKLKTELVVPLNQSRVRTLITSGMPEQTPLDKDPRGGLRGGNREKFPQRVWENFCRGACRHTVESQNEKSQLEKLSSEKRPGTRCLSLATIMEWMKNGLLPGWSCQ